MPLESSLKFRGIDDLCSRIVTLVDGVTQKLVRQQQVDDESNLIRLRRGDFASSPSQAMEVEAFLEDAQSCLAEYDRSISQLESASDRLKAARNAIKRSVDIAGTLIAPVHRLPEDVLVEIFLVYLSISVPKEVLEDNPLHSHYTLSFAFYGGGLYCPTLDLSHVCTFWRKVTFSRPTLWASLSLELDVASNSDLPSLLSHHLSRSSQHSLNLNLYGVRKPGTRQIQAFSMLVDHCARWQCLRMDVADTLWVQFLSRLQTVDRPLILPRLEVLCLPGSAHGMLAHAPSLKILQGAVYGLKLSWKEFREANFTNLKEIRYIQPCDASLGQFLAHTPTLEECNLFATSGLSTDIQDIFHLSSLTTLSITLGGCSPEIWQTLRTPNVTSLVLDSFFEWYDDIKDKVEKVSAMLLQSGCTLQRIRLEDEATPFAIGLLQSHPSVEYLTLHYINDSSDPRDLFAALTISEGDMPLAPNLRYLEIDDINIDDDPCFTDHICNMIKSRAGILDNGHSLSLKELVIAFRGSSAGKACRRLRSRLTPFVALGLHLSLLNHSDTDTSDNSSDSEVEV